MFSEKDEYPVFNKDVRDEKSLPTRQDSCSFNIQILLFFSFAFDVDSLCCTDHQDSHGSLTSEYLETYTHILFVTGNRRMNFLVNCHAYST